jgi:predicted dinucleotide-binding enzyme
MRIGILGRGDVGRTLAEALRRAGHDVRDAGSWPADVEAALDGAEVVVLAVPGSAVDELLRTHGGRLEGVVVVDAANSIGAGPMHHAAAFEEYAPGALMVRAFNTLGYENFGDPAFAGERADLFFCAPEGRATEVAEALITDVGLRPVRVGGPDTVDVVDGVARLWFALAFGAGQGRRLAFRALGLP